MLKLETQVMRLKHVTRFPKSYWSQNPQEIVQGHQL